MYRNRTLFLTQFSILLAIEAIFCFTPLGSIPIGPIVATLAMLPVMMTAILLGTKAGSLMGLFGGLFSLVIWTFTPPTPIIAFAFSPFYSLGEIQGNFWSLVICLLPRVLTGTVTGLLYHRVFKRSGSRVVRFGLAGFLGSLVNTFGVMGGIWLFFGEPYSGVAGTVMSAIVLTTVLTNGLPEAVVSALVAVFVCQPLTKALGRKA